MDYEPLHHKYRPQTFAQLVGQVAIATTLSNALRQNRIAPAYLFCGPRGTGKTSSARILAKSLNCLNSDAPTPDPCGECQVCREIAIGNALDIVEIDAASNTGVDNIRELIERAQFAPVQCRYKLYVLDEVHMLSTAAFNALLKTLEEPPEQVVFVLATTDPQRVLPTIISRCQRFDFRRIPLEAMVQHLNHIAQQESITITDEALQLVAQISQGGLRDAESLLDQLSLLEDGVTVEAVWELVGAVPERDLLALVQAITQDDGSQLLERARHLMDRGREPLIVLQSLVAFYRDLLIAKTASTRQDLVAITLPTWESMCDFAQHLTVPTLLASQQHLRTSEVQVKNTTQPRLWLEITLMGLLPSALGAVSVPNVSIPKVQIPSTPSAKAKPSTSPPPSAPSASPTSPPPSTVPHTPTSPLSPLKGPSSIDVAKVTPTANGVSKTDVPKVTPTVKGASPPPSTPLSSGPASPTSQPVPQPAPLTPPASDPQPSPAFGNMRDIWGKIIASLTPYGTQALMKQQGELISFDGVEAQVGIKSQKLMRMAQDRLPNLEVAFEKVFGHKVRVSLEVVVAEESSAESSETTSTAPLTPAPPIRRVEPPAIHHSPPPLNVPPVAPAPSSMDLPPPPESFSNGVSATVGPPNGSTPDKWEVESDLDRSVKSFAQFFNGQIVNLDDAEESNSKQKKKKSKKPKSSQPGPDVPF